MTTLAPMDHDAVHRALRTRALSVTVATTGAVSLSVTSVAGTLAFVRQTGSFVADGFRRGMEAITSGFLPPIDNGNGVITAVTATELYMRMFVVSVSGGKQTVAYPTLIADPISSGRTIRAAAPSMRSFENVAPTGLTVFVPEPGIPYLEEQYSPSTSRAVTTPISRAQLSDTGDYILTWHGVTGVGSTALRKSIDAVIALFKPGTSLTAATGLNVLIQQERAPFSGQIIQLTSGPILLLTISWRVRSRNVILA